MFPIDCCSTKPWSFSIIIYNNTSIACKYHANNNPSSIFQPYPKSTPKSTQVAMEDIKFNLTLKTKTPLNDKQLHVIKELTADMYDPEQM